MSDERIKGNRLPPKVKPSIEDLTKGTILTIQQRGFEVRRVVYETDRLGIDRRRGQQRIEAVFHDVKMPERSFPVSYAAVLRGELGPTRIIGIESQRPIEDVSQANIGQEGSQPAGLIPELGTDMIAVAFRESPDDKTLAVVSAVEYEDMAILGLPETPDKQLLKVLKEDLLKGGNETYLLEAVDPKFSLLKKAMELERKSYEVSINKDPGGNNTHEYLDKPAASADVRFAETYTGEPTNTIGGDKVLVQLIDRSAVEILASMDTADKLARRTLAMLWALKNGTLRALTIGKGI